MQFDHITAEQLTLKIATTPDEVKAAQRLRYDIFYAEMGARPVGDVADLQLDYDVYDEICDHLIVIDENAPDAQKVVGTYRMLEHAKAVQNNICLYCETEFNIDKLKATGGKIMEISRSCIHPDYRTKTAINLLWKGIAACVFKNDIAYLVGVPSFQGIDPNKHIAALSYLRAHHQTREDARPFAHPQGNIGLTLLSPDQIDSKKIFNELPPLIKGYLRIGVSIGDGVFVDQQFNTVDICVVLDIANVADRYFKHYKRYDTAPENTDE